jgi:hypothetical protein
MRGYNPRLGGGYIFVGERVLIWKQVEILGASCLPVVSGCECMVS